MTEENNYEPYYPITEYNLLEVLNVEKKNVSPTGLTQYQITRFGNTYKDPLVKHKRENFWDRTDRFEVVMNDPGMFAISGRYIEETMSKLPKCYEVSEGGEPIEILADVWEKWETLNIAEMFKDIAKKMLDDGYCIGRRYLAEDRIGYKAYGNFESTPFLWHRLNTPFNPITHNTVWKYDVFYIPVPQGSNNLNTYNVMEVRDELFPQDPTVFHFTRGKFNFGIGESRIQPIWDPITKLRKTSHADYHRSSIFPIFEYPESWDGEEFLPEMIDKFRRVDEIEGLAMAKFINEQTGEVTEFPRFWERTFAESPGQAKADSTSGGSLLRNAEYARILMALGYSETYFVGNQPGAVTGSKLDLTRDDRVDIREFQHYIKLIKDLNLWLLEIGAFEGISPESMQFIMEGNYNIMHHLEWTVLENNLAAAEMAEDQAENEAQDVERQNVALDFKYNAMVESLVIYALKNNQNFPSTPVQSTWISHVAIKDKRLFVKIPGWKKGPWAGFEFESSDIANLKGRDMMASGSKGAWMWDNIWSEGGLGPRPTQPGINENILGIHFANDPFGGEAEVGGFGTFEERRESLLQPGQGLLGTEKTRRPLIQTPTTPSIKPATPGIMEGPSSGFGMLSPNITTIAPINATMAQLPKAARATPGRVFDPKSITGSRKIGPGPKRKVGRKGPGSPPPIIPFNLTNSAPDVSQLSYKRYNALALEVFGEGIGNKTWQKQRKIQDHLNMYYKMRFNSISVGNVMNFDVPLQYIYNGRLSVEFACKKEFKKIRKHNGSLYLYSDMEHGGSRITVGDYEYWWDNDKDIPMAKFNYDNKKILELVPEDSIIAQRINAGLTPEMSTEYYAATKEIEGKKYQVKFRDLAGDNVFSGIAIVNKGNCGPPFCEFEEQPEVKD